MSRKRTTRYGYFFQRPGKSVVRKFSGKIVETQDKISAQIISIVNSHRNPSGNPGVRRKYRKTGPD
jgi:hypothetical protein